eukprot:105441_1
MNSSILMQSQKQSIQDLVNGYIRKIESSFTNNKLIPNSINTLCLHYFDPKCIEIYCKIRLLRYFETAKGLKPNIKCNETNGTELIMNNNETNIFEFDKVYGTKYTIKRMSEDTMQHIQELLSCNNSKYLSIFTFGGSGSGKHEALRGSIHKSIDGIIVNGTQYIFDIMNKNKNVFDYQMHCSIFDNRLQKIDDHLKHVTQDMLKLIKDGKRKKKKKVKDKKKKTYKIIHSSNGETDIADLNWIKADCIDDIKTLLRLSRMYCESSTGYLNHMQYVNYIFICKIYCKNMKTNVEYIKKIYFIELGSYNIVKKSVDSYMGKHERKMLQPSYKTFAYLGNILCNAWKGVDSSKYEEIKVVQLLKNQLCGINCKVLFYVFVSENCKDENIKALEFATEIKERINNLNKTEKK